MPDLLRVQTTTWWRAEVGALRSENDDLALVDSKHQVWGG